MSSSHIFPDSDLYHVSPAELQVFMKHYGQTYRTGADDKVVEVARGALRSSQPAEFSPEDLNRFKQMEQGLLGEYAIATTFKKEMGIADRAKAKKGDWQLDLVGYRRLLSPWIGKGQVAEYFTQLEPYEQKILLKALAHFSLTSDTLQQGMEGLHQRDLMILHTMSGKLQKWFGPGPLPGPREVKNISSDLFKQLYLVYQMRGPEPLEKGRSPFSIKRELYQIGEKRIGGELEVDFRHLMGAKETLRERFNKNGALGDDLLFYLQACRLALIKGEAQMALYAPHTKDPDLALLQAKAMANLAELYALEAFALGLLEECQLPDPFETDRTEKKSLAKVSELLSGALTLVERADLATHPKGAILCAKLRVMGGTPLTKETLEKAKADLQKGMFWGDEEAILTLAKLYSLAFRQGIEGVKEKDAIDLLKPLGKRGANGLRDHFRAGSKEAGEALIQLLKNRLAPPTPREKLQRVWQAILNLFFFGPTSLISEQTFLSKDPHRFSKGEIDFLIEASLLGLNGAKEVINQGLKGPFGPKIPLEQAQSFLDKFLLMQDPDLVVNGQTAFRHLDILGHRILHSRWPPAQLTPILEGYLSRMYPKETAFHLLQTLNNQLKEREPVK